MLRADAESTVFAGRSNFRGMHINGVFVFMPFLSIIPVDNYGHPNKSLYRGRGLGFYRGELAKGAGA